MFVAALHRASGATRALEGLCPSASMGIGPLPTLPDLRESLRRATAGNPKLRALPIADKDRVKVAVQLGPLATFVAFAAASRWDDVRRLKRRHFIPDAPTPGSEKRWVVVWGETKANQEGVSRLGHTALLPAKLPKLVQSWLQRAKPEDRVTTLTTTQVERRLKKIVPLPGHREHEQTLAGCRLRPHYSAQSIKRAAVNLGVERAAAAEAAEQGTGFAELMKVSRAAKHKSMDSTREYCTRPAAWAVATNGINVPRLPRASPTTSDDASTSSE